MPAKIMAGRRRYFPQVLVDFDKTIMKYPSIQRFPGGASNDLIPDLQHPKNPVPLGSKQHAEGCSFRLTDSLLSRNRWAILVRTAHRVLSS